jgi:hypothetical protein
MAIDIGRIAYQAYVNQIKKARGSARFLKWSDLNKEECDAWRSVGIAVMQHMDECQKQMEENPELIG